MKTIQNMFIQVSIATYAIYVLAVIAALALNGCDQNWADASRAGAAPGAPDCGEDDSECAEVAPPPGYLFPAGSFAADDDFEKHGPQGDATIHEGTIWPHGEGTMSLQTHLCGLYPGQPCFRYTIHQGVEYGAIFAADCPAGRRCFIRSIGWNYRKFYEPNTAWDTMPYNTMQVCTDRECRDATNTQTSITCNTTGTLCQRHGRTSFSALSWTGRALFSMWFQLQWGYTPWYGPGAGMTTFTFTDQPL